MTARPTGPVSLLTLAPSRNELVPWTDRRGRLSALRSVVFTLLLLPGAWLALRWITVGLGAEPVKTAIHSTGYWAVWLLVASLMITPARAVTAVQNVVVIRRMVGNAALVYAVAHLVLYCADENWRVGTIVSEILNRFYLTIGFVALLGLTILGLTSTDGWIYVLGKAWKRLHRIVYLLIVLALFHYLLQSKLDVSQAMVATGIFIWLMAWRLLPAGWDRTWLPIAGLAVAAAALTLVVELLWYRFATRIDPMKVFRGEIDISYGLHPAGQVLMLGLVAALAVVIRQLGQGRFGTGPVFSTLVAALGAFVDDGLALFLGWSSDDPLTGLDAAWAQDLLWCMALAALGFIRWTLRDTMARRVCDAVWFACIVYQVVRADTGDADPGFGIGALAASVCALAASRIWPVSRPAAMAMLPLACLLAYGAVKIF